VGELVQEVANGEWTVQQDALALNIVVRPPWVLLPFLRRHAGPQPGPPLPPLAVGGVDALDRRDHIKPQKMEKQKKEVVTKRPGGTSQWTHLKKGGFGEKVW